MPLLHSLIMLIINNVFQMTQPYHPLIKQAASLILCRASTRLNSLYDYELFMFQRNDSLKSWGSVLAFPGGKYDPQVDQQLSISLGQVDTKVTTALRECFEETGIFLTEKPFIESKKISELEQIKLRYIASEFYKNSLNLKKNGQQKHNKHESQLVSFFKQITQVAAPSSKILPFIRLVTVPVIKSRFDTWFYLHKIEQFRALNFMKFSEHEKYIHSTDQINMNSQSASYGWYTPSEVLSGYLSKKKKLAPPQFIMLNIMSSFFKYQDLHQFMQKCSHNWINSAPNIVSIVRNRGYKKQQYPFAATLIGDAEFPYQFCEKSEKNQHLIEQLSKCKEITSNWTQYQKNRILFKKPSQFFQDSFSSECTIQDSVMSKFVGSQKLSSLLNKYQ